MSAKASKCNQEDQPGLFLFIAPLYKLSLYANFSAMRNILKIAKHLWD